MVLLSQLAIPMAQSWTVGTLFILGACIGSFLNVVVYRLPAGLSLVSPPSRCPKCETPIRAFDNIPILGWLILRGRCRACSVWIPMRYPFVELATAVLFGYVGWTRVDYATVNGFTILVSLIAASLLVIAVCWFVDRIKTPIWFYGLTIVVVAASIGLSTVPKESTLYVILGGLAFLPYAIVRRKWDAQIPWQSLLIAGALAAVVLAIR